MTSVSGLTNLLLYQSQSRTQSASECSAHHLYPSPPVATLTSRLHCRPHIHLHCSVAQVPLRANQCVLMCLSRCVCDWCKTGSNNLAHTSSPSSCTNKFLFCSQFCTCTPTKQSREIVLLFLCLKVLPSVCPVFHLSVSIHTLSELWQKKGLLYFTWCVYMCIIIYLVNQVCCL